jgi:hypothetical protein
VASDYRSNGFVETDDLAQVPTPQRDAIGGTGDDEHEPEQIVDPSDRDDRRRVEGYYGRPMRLAALDL